MIQPHVPQRVKRPITARLTPDTARRLERFTARGYRITEIVEYGIRLALDELARKEPPTPAA